jgi:hypothetical protein
VCRCTIAAKCAQAAHPQAYLSAIDDAASSSAEAKCPRLSRPLQPQNISLLASMQETVEVCAYDSHRFCNCHPQVTIDNLPSPVAQSVYECVFGSSDAAKTVATFKAPNTIVCPLPPYDQRPRVRGAADHIVIPLRLRSSATATVFFEERFIFFDCTAQQLYVLASESSFSHIYRCTTCVRSEWSCEWCLLDNRCVHDAALCTNQVHIVHQVCLSCCVCSVTSYPLCSF